MQALRESRSLTPEELYDRVARDGLDMQGLAELIEALRRDGLVRVDSLGRARLP